MQIIAIVVSFALTVAAVALLVPAVRKMLGVIRSGQPAPGRSGNPGGRAVTMLKETFLHTRMLQWHWVGIMHWFVYAAFLFLSTAVLAAYFQLFMPDFAWPVVGHWYPFEWFSEVIGLLSTVGIVFLIIYRQKHHPRSLGRQSRFFGSTMWQAYFVEALALLEGAAILFVRGAEWKLDEEAGRSHYPISSWIGDALYPVEPSSLENLIYFIAMFKIALAMVWLMVIARNITMGIAWHRFTAWFNIFYKREADGSTALGAMKPLTSAGVPVTLDDLEELDEDSTLGVGQVEDFSWKGMLDFTTCTECGRCQSQCPAWNTEKPLSPKLLITAMRDHAYAKAPYVQAGGEGSEAATALLEKDEVLAREAARPLVGDTGDEWFYMPEDGSAVIDADVLWNCTSCGACVQQCPVDIEHVDHIMDMRRYQVLVEANFPAELNQLFKGLENKGNPWNMSSTARMDWAKGLDFDVPVVGEDLESLESVDWLFWVGCAGAYEDRAKKTTRAVAELLDMAGISFGVLGNGETCTGDPARRAGNEFVFQGLAQQNVETFKEYKVKKVVSTCAHCFNTLKNEYKDFGIELEVVHHTQLLNRLVREGKLTPIKDGAGAAKRSITYHDPCYLGRHNQVYSPPRELLQILPGAEFTEMERNSEKSFCCGAGGARMWMEENIGERINVNRTKEAVGTGADQIAVGCPFCRVMLSDGLTAEQAKGNAREEVEILDVAQMLLASVKGESATKAGPGTTSAPAAAAAAGAASGDTDVATKAEPESGDVTDTADTVTETADVGPAAKASGGSSLFDLGDSSTDSTPATSVADTPSDATRASGTPKKEESGSLFDLGGEDEAPASAPASETEPAAQPAPPAKSESTTQPAQADLGSGGSLFDLTPEETAPAAGTGTPAPAEAPAPAADEAKAEQDEAPAAKPAPSTAPASGLGSTGSLFDIAADPVPSGEQATVPAPQKVADAPAPDTDTADTPTSGEQATVTAPQKVADAPPSSGTTSTPATSIPEAGSLFDIEAPTPVAAPAAPAPDPTSEPAAEPATEEPEAAPSDETAAPASEKADVPEAGATASEETVATETQVSDVPEPEASSEAPTAPSSGSVSTPATSIPEGGSLFDIEAPTPVAAPTAAPTAASAPEPAAEPTAASRSDETAAPATEASDAPEAEATTSEETTTPAEGLAGGAALSQAATFAAADEEPAAHDPAEDEPAAQEQPVAESETGSEAESETGSEAESETGSEAESETGSEAESETGSEAESETEPATEETDAPAPAANGATHTPRTDVDITEAGSLFDL